MKFTLKDFKGVIPALLTAFDENENYDPRRQKQLIDRLIDMGAGGFYLTGNTGHGASMDIEERVRAVDSICEIINGRVPVVAHIAAVSAKKSAYLAKQAEISGCTGISAVPSYFYKLTPEQMYKYYYDISSASNLPLIIYAQTQNYTPSVEMFLKLSEIENVKGLKYTGTDHYMMGRIKEHLGRDFFVYSGCDEMILSGLISGADAAIGSTYNLLPDLNIRIVSKFFGGEIKEAQKDLLAANAILEVMFKYDLFAALRAGLSLMGIDSGFNPSPFKAVLNETEKENFRKDMLRLRSSLNIEPIAFFNALG